jgi:hemin uptake protein HemP
MAGTRPELEQAAALHRSSPRPVQPAPDHAPGASAPRRWQSNELFGPAQEIEIAHGQAIYRLRLTSLGKLILTK